MTCRSRSLVLCRAVLTVGVSFLVGCGPASRTSPSGVTGELPDQEVTDFVVTETDQGRPQWTLYARDASIFNARDLVVAKRVKVDFFDDKGKRSSELTADQGELNKQSRHMKARGHVVLETAEGARMTTEAMEFDNATSLITSDQLVRVERGGDVLSGTGFQSDQDLRHFEFKSKVTATVRSRAGTTFSTRGGR